MSKAFIASVIQEALGVTGAASARATDTLIASIKKSMKKDGKFTLPSFGTFRVQKTKARKALNPRTGEPVKVKAGTTVRFKASPVLKADLSPSGAGRPTQRSIASSSASPAALAKSAPRRGSESAHA